MAALRRNTPKLRTLLALVVLAAPAGLGAQAAPLTGLDAYIESAMTDWKVPGLAIAVVRGDSVIFSRGYGVTDVATGERVDENTLFAIASTSKAFTVAALGMLVDEGKVDWDDPVTKHLPGFQLADPWITSHLTVRDLLTHRAGVAREDNVWIAAPFDRAEILRRARHLDQVAEFRARYGYNNIMFIAAGEVVGAASGIPWEDFVARRIFTPLGMQRSTAKAAEVELRGNVAASHTETGDQVRSVPRRDYDNIGGAGAVFSSVRDMAQWLRLHLGHGTYAGQRLLEEETLEEMYTPHNPLRSDSTSRRLFPDTRFRAYALGWNVQDYHGRRLVHHSGSINYTRTHVAFMPDEGIGIVAIANLSSSNLQYALVWRVLDALLGIEPTDWSAEYLAQARRGDERAERSRRELAEARLPNTTPALPLDDYCGTYENELYGPVTLAREDERLVLRYSPDYVADLEHWHRDVYRAQWRRPGGGSAFVRFSLDERARITALELDGFGTFRRER